jgi:hypothetical protein
MASGGVLAYLRVEKPRVLFLGGSAGVVAAADVATAAPPVASTACAGTSAAHAGASAVRAGTSAVRAASLTSRLVTDATAPAPGDISSAASTALGEGGAGSHLSGRARPPSLSSSSSSDASTPKSPGRRVPAARAAKTPHSVPGALAAGFSSPSCASPAPAPATALRARPGSGRGRVRLRGVHSHHLQRESETPSHDDAPQINREKGGGNPLTNGP